MKTIIKLVILVLVLNYSAEVKPFHLWSMVDALILFPLLGIANGLLYPWFFPKERSSQ
jgi:hypothetical protein